MQQKVLDLGVWRPYNGFVRCSNSVPPESKGAPGKAGGASGSPSGRVPTGELTMKGLNMYNATEQFAEINKAGVAQATKLAALALENAEKLARLNLDAAKVMLAQSVEGATATTSVKDVQDLMALRAKYAESGVQTAMVYSKSLYEMAAEAQAQYSAFAEEAWSVYSKGVASWVDKASKAAPAGSETGFNALRSTVAATTAAFDQFQKASKQVVNLADASMRAAAANATKAAPKGRRAA
jgi:phasin family protein